MDRKRHPEREASGLPTAWEQFRAGWNSAGWLIPFTLYLLPASLATALLWRIIAPPAPAEGPPVPHWVVVGSAGLLVGMAILLLLGALVLRLARWATMRLSDRTTRTELSSQLGSSPLAALQLRVSGIVRLISIVTQSLLHASKE